MNNDEPSHRRQPPWSQVFCWNTVHGLLVGVSLPRPDEFELPGEYLHPEDAQHALALALRRRPSWTGGRVALNRALAELGISTPSRIDSDDRGAPTLPPGFVGSVSHKDDVAVALLARAQDFTLGVDIEDWLPERPKIAKHVLTDTERRQLLLLDDPTEYWRHLIVRFSVKECVFKALDPDLRRYITFKEAQVDWDGHCGAPTVRLQLTKSPPTDYDVKATLRSWSGHLITSVKATKLDNSPS